MSILLVDIGNTRVKWAVLTRGARAEKLSRLRALAHGGRGAVLRQVVNSAPRGTERVVAVCVAGAPMERALVAAVRARFDLSVEFARSTRSAAGVRNGYRDTWRLGADRWVGAIAAYDLARGRDVLAVNAGTALTLDFVDARGRHRGGAIAPGPSTMISSLLDNTQGIRRRAGGAAHARARGLFATDTAQAVAAGATFAAAALVDRAVAEARKVAGRAPLLLLTGGAADLLAPHLQSRARAVPDLVLRGLAVLARGTNTHL